MADTSIKESALSILQARSRPETSHAPECGRRVKRGDARFLPMRTRRPTAARYRAALSPSPTPATQRRHATNARQSRQSRDNRATVARLSRGVRRTVGRCAAKHLQLGSAALLPLPVSMKCHHTHTINSSSRFVF